MSRIATILLFGFLLFNVSHAYPRLKDDETVILFPANAYQTANLNTWKVQIHGWVFEPVSELKAVFEKLLHIKPKTLAEKKRYRRRAHFFLVDNERGKIFTLTIGKHQFTIGPTATNGHFYQTITLPNNLIQRQKKRTPGGNGVFVIDLTQKKADRRFSVNVLLIPMTGVTMISDIDDTIKVSNVRDKKELLRNTFVRPFRPAPGMSAMYQKLQRQGAVFHYVSASPWQLYPPLRKFTHQHSFPQGSFHLKIFRWRDRSFFNMFKASKQYKINIIKNIISNSPERRFVLIGDSGEHDPEIYGEIARLFPSKVKRILIRNVTNESVNSDRFKQAFRSLAKGHWELFL